MAKLRRAAALVEKLDTLRFHEDGSIAGRPAAVQAGVRGREMLGRSKAKGKVQKAKDKRGEEWALCAFRGWNRRLAAAL
jgi:hypothetical protein